MTPKEDTFRLAEALFFSSKDPVPLSALAALLPEGVDAAALAAEVARFYADRGMQLTETAGGWHFRTAADLGPTLRKVVNHPRRLPRAALETLALIAYHQPVTRSEIEAVRGTPVSQQTMEVLLELRIVESKGRKEVPGRPTLWGTTPEFLVRFGLKSLSDLPKREELLTETQPVNAQSEVVSASILK